MKDILAWEQIERVGRDRDGTLYGAVQEVFADDWLGHTPRTSRLVHGSGIVALWCVMELLYARDGAKDRAAFRKGLSVFQGRTVWTCGSWKFSDSEVVPWNAIQNVPRQLMALAQHLVSLVKRGSVRRLLHAKECKTSAQIDACVATPTTLRDKTTFTFSDRSECM